jgi:lipopolysaccharide transport system permease protein
MSIRTRPTVVIQPRTSVFDVGLKDLWQYRELLYFLVWRDVKVRYKQTLFGAAWAILQPVLTMLIFTGIFGYLARMPSEGIPYPVFVYTALLPWSYFARSTERSGMSLVNNSQLITRVYFPRLIVPISAIGAPLIDLVIAFVFLVVLMAWYGISPNWGVLLLPLFLLLALLTALAVSLFLSALNVRYRDIAHILPFLTQLWMFSSPLMYPVSLVPERWRLLYSLNPMTGVIEGFRWALLGTQGPGAGIMLTSTAVVVALLLAGIAYFKNVERTFADVI